MFSTVQFYACHVSGFENKGEAERCRHKNTDGKYVLTTATAEMEMMNLSAWRRPSRRGTERVSVSALMWGMKLLTLLLLWYAAVSQHAVDRCGEVIHAAELFMNRAAAGKIEGLLMASAERCYALRR